VQVAERPLKIAKVATEGDVAGTKAAGKSAAAGKKDDAAAARPARAKKTAGKAATANS
jgi:hypothetical protein